MTKLSCQGQMVSRAHKRSLCSPKQLLRVSKSIQSSGYSQSQVYHTIFFKHSIWGKITILNVYVDDIILIRNNEVEIGELKKVLAQEFEKKRT